jgi:hypothetical protein
MRRIFFTFSVCFGLVFISVDAQTTALLHTNQPFYVSGEVIWYKLYLSEDFPVGPKVITASIFDRDGEVVHQSYLRREEGFSVFGHYQIPFDFNSGIYRLVFSASREKSHEPVLLAETFLPIYNDFRNKEEKASVSGSRSVDYAPKDRDGSKLRIEILPTQESYEVRSSARLRIKVTNSIGEPVPADLSVSIRDQVLFESDHPLFNTIHRGQAFRDTARLEENISLRGTIYDTTGQEILPYANVGAYVSREKQFVYHKADQSARFTLDLPDIFGPNPVHIGGFLPEDLRVELDQQAGSRAPFPKDLPHTPTLLQYLEWSQKRKLIYQLYGRLEQPFSASFPPANGRSEEADSPIVLDEYKAFPDIPDMAKELLIPIRFRKQKGGIREARIFDPTKTPRKFHSRGPLFIVDGMLTRNSVFIAELDITKVERFDLYYKFERGLRLFGPMARYGLVMIESRNRDIELPEKDQENLFVIHGFQAEIKYPIQLEAAGEEEVRLDPSLFWAPDMRTNEQGEVELSIPLPDDRSRFRVEVVAQGANGQRGVGDAFFEAGRGE